MVTEEISPRPASKHWKERLYDSYVSSDQAGSHIREDQPFAAVAPFVKKVIRDHVPADTSLRILDLACGHGTYIHFLKEAGYLNVAGVDISGEQVNLAHKLGIPEVEEGTLADFLERQSAPADVIFLMDILEHLERQELFDTLDQVYRKMRPGGKLIIHVPNAEGLYGMRIRYGDMTHVQAFTPNSMGQMLKTIGFNNIQSFEDKPVPHGFKSRIRSIIWALGTLQHRLLLMAETGSTKFVLSQNMLVTATR